MQLKKKEETKSVRVDQGKQDTEKTDRMLLWPLSDSKALVPDDPLIQEQLDRLLNCIDWIEMARNGFKEADSVGFVDELVAADAGSAWSNRNPGRRLANRHHLEKRYQLIGQAIAALMEVVSTEVGIYAINARL